VDEKFEADVGEKRGGEGNGELDGEFQKRAETFFVVNESQDKQGEDADENDDELIYFADEAGEVNGDGVVEPGESARGDEELYNQNAGDEERKNSGDDGDTAAEGDGALVVSVYCRDSDEAGA
jgi:hypothetical protein